MELSRDEPSQLNAKGPTVDAVEDGPGLDSGFQGWYLMWQGLMFPCFALMIR